VFVNVAATTVGSSGSSKATYAALGVSYGSSSIATLHTMSNGSSVSTYRVMSKTLQLCMFGANHGGLDTLAADILLYVHTISAGLANFNHFENDFMYC
jgi:hypothetical protein